MAETLKRSEKLRHRTDISRVLHQGRRLPRTGGTSALGGSPLVLCYCPRTASPEDQPAESDRPSRRVAFLLSRQRRGVGTSLPLTSKFGAVARNRLKRRLREIYRRNKILFPDHHDIIIKARPDAALLSFRQLLATLLRLTEEAVRDV